MEYKKLAREIEELKKEMADIKESRGIKGFFRKSLTKTNMLTGVGLAFFLTSMVLWAAQITFIDGTVISADDVNSNFTELYDRVFLKNGSDLYYNNGNVGIGTGSPVAKLDVEGGDIHTSGTVEMGANPCSVVTNMVNSNGITLVNVSCPVGSYLTGGGCASNDGDGSTTISQNYPEGNAWYCTMNDTDSNNEDFTAYAMCCF